MARIFLYDGRASFELDSSMPLVGIYVVLPGREYDATARRDVEEAIALLPKLQSWVVAAHSPDGPNDGTEDHDLSYMEINGDEVYLDYCARSYNSSWGHSFQKRCAGHWQPQEAVPPPAMFLPEWRTEPVVALARGISETRDYSTMPVLADALEDAGCASSDILAHCRSGGPHVQSCWVVGLVFGNEPAKAEPRAAPDAGR